MGEFRPSEFSPFQIEDTTVYMSVYIKKIIASDGPPHFTVTEGGSNKRIGRITFNPSWRQYCFYPETNTAMLVIELNDIADFITKVESNEEHL